jgi:acetyl-CoA C-acetyltransferase
VLDALVERSGADPALVEDVIMGCVGQVGEQGINIARNAGAGLQSLPESVPATSVDRQCGSSQQAIHFAAATVMSGAMDVVIAAGVESMSRVPMGLSSQLPYKNGFGTYKSPRIEARYPGIQFSQFTGAEMMAKKYGLSRAELDAYAFPATSAPWPPPRPASSPPRSCRSRSPGRRRVERHDADEGIRWDARWSRSAR